MSIHIERPASRELILTELKPVIAGVTDICISLFGSRLQSVYLLGSAARGEYKPGISDFDVRAIVSGKKEGEKEKVDQTAAPLQKEFNVAKMELDAYTVDALNKRDWLQFYVLVDGICVWGNPYEPTSPLPTTREALAAMLASHLLEHYERTPQTLERIKAGIEKGDSETWRTYAKRAMRLGNTIAILKTGQYTQNSDNMAALVAENVPEISEPIEKLNQYRLYPPEDLEGFIDLAHQAEIVRSAVLEYGLQKLGK